MTDDREVILKVENLRTWFPVKKGTFKKVVDHVKAVDDVSLEIYKGETLGIVGESGCGKSTFGKSIMRLEQITDGKVIFNYDGQFKDVAQFDKKEMFEFRKKVQMVFQDPYSALNPQKTIYTSFEEPLKTHGYTSVEEREAIMQRVLKLVNIPTDYLMRYPHEFSGGQRQRLSLARALVPQSDILIMDDSASALDYATDARLRKAIQDMKRKPTVFIVSQRTSSIQNADMILVLDDGKIAGQGTHEQLLKSCNIYREIYETQFKKEEA